MLAALLMKGEQDFEGLDPVERSRFVSYQFARLNIADYILDLEAEGVVGLNFRMVDFTVHEYQTKPGLQAFIKSVEDIWVGSDELYARLTGG